MNAEWLTWGFRVLVGFIVTLVIYMWKHQDRRISKLEEQKEKAQEKGGLLTYDEHEIVCSKAMTGLREWLQVKFDLLDEQLENKILKELKKMNGKKD